MLLTLITLAAVASFSLSGLGPFIFALAVIAILWWAIDYFKLPKPFQIVLVVIAALIAINLLAMVLGVGGIPLHLG